MTFSGTLCLQNDDKMREREGERKRKIERAHNGKGAFVAISWNEPDQRVLC